VLTATTVVAAAWTRDTVVETGDDDCDVDVEGGPGTDEGELAIGAGIELTEDETVGKLDVCEDGTATLEAIVLAKVEPCGI
jgi:hypothetical protein